MKGSPHAPAFAAPMLAKPVGELSECPGWSLEVKFDGYRIEAVKNGPDVRLLSRRGNDFTKRFAKAAQAVSKVKAGSKSGGRSLKKCSKVQTCCFLLHL